jgi:AcrR family transcriptional regulator
MSADTLPTKDRLLRAADELFYKEGIHATGIDRLVDVAGVAKMTLYNNYSSKDELVAAWLTWRHEDWEHRLAEKLNRSESASQRVLAVFDAYIDSATEPGHRGCVFLNAVAEIPGSDHPARAVVESHKDSVRDFLVGQAEELGTPDPQQLGEQLFVLLEGGVVTAGVRGDVEPLRAARSAAETLLTGS